MRRLKFPIPISIVLFLVLTAAGAYYVRKGMLERAMIMSMNVGDEAMIASLLRWWPCPADVRDDWGRAPIHCMAAAGNVEAAERLLDMGCNVNTQTSRTVFRVIAKGQEPETRAFDTPLVWAVSCGQKEMAEFLIRRGANVRNAWTMVDVRVSDVESFDQALLVLDVAVRGGRPDIVRLLLDHDAHPDGLDALHAAVERKNVEIVRLLLDHGADANARGFGEKSPLRLAVDARDNAMVDLLRAHGAKE